MLLRPFVVCNCIKFSSWEFCRATLSAWQLMFVCILTASQLNLYIAHICRWSFCYAHFMALVAGYLGLDWLICQAGTDLFDRCWSGYHHIPYISLLHLPRTSASSSFNCRLFRAFSATACRVIFILPLGLTPCSTSLSILFSRSFSSCLYSAQSQHAILLIVMKKLVCFIQPDDRM